MVEWHSLKVEDVFKALNSSEKGLNGSEVKKRIEQYGYNELEEQKKISPAEIFLNQFKSLMVIILIVAAFFSALLHEVIDSVVIMIIIILNAVLGFVQEYRAEKAISALKNLAPPKAKVIRDGHEEIIEARELVPGDIIFLETGDSVPVDARIFESSNLKVDESILTGESVSVSKDARFLSKKTGQISDRKNMVFMGTIITYGSAKAVVSGTGMQTEIGKITHLVQTAEQKKTPLQEKLDHFTKVLALFTLSLCAVIFVVGIAFGISPFEMFMTAVSLAVSAVPEGLPAIVTATLAIGVQRMAKKNAIIRHLPAVQTLGTTTVICTDKTGTLTKNEMTVQKIFTGKNEYDITGFGYEPKGEFILKNKKINPLLDTNIVQLLRIANFCNNSVLENDEKKGRYIIGDPTEGALVVLAKKAGLRDTSSDYQRVEEIPFDSERKMMTTIHKMKNGKIVSFSKGAPEVVINKCSFVLENGKVIRITENYKKQILEKTHEFASQAIRVLLLAYKELPRDYTAKQAETGMVFAGLAGMIDPPRKEVPDALKNCRTAGIKVIMITGDHAVTAKAIAEKIGLADGSAKVITGQELDLMTDEQLKSVIRDVNIFARTSAPHKVRILTTLQENGEIVAMTGDGVNDAPALRHADIGIAMYLKGTDVAKEASEMILVDDNFASIVNAVKEGRSIYDNIKKFIRFLLSANFDELFMIITSIMAGLPLPFIPLQILWLNLITDGLPALSLGIDIPEKDTMKRKPRDPNESILKSIVSFAVVAGILNYAVGYGLFLNFLDLGVEKARTVCFTLSVVFELFVAYAARFPNKMFFRDVLTNIKLLISVIVSFCLQLAVIFTPFFQNIFQTVPLSLTELVTIFVSSLLAIFALEFWEALINKEHELRKLFSK